MSLRDLAVAYETFYDDAKQHIMASIYTRKDSPYYYIDYKLNGQRQAEPTPYRKDNPLDRHRAKKMALEKSLEEMRETPISRNGGWLPWVEDFLHSRSRNPKSFTKYLCSWRWIYHFLQEQKIHDPRQLRREHVRQYIGWRTGYRKKAGRAVSKNTALIDIKVLRVILGEAVACGRVDYNVCLRLGIPKDDPKEKFAMTDEDIRICRKALHTKPQWMRRCFFLSLLTGCRFGDTARPWHWIDLSNRILTFDCPKGGKERAFSIPIGTKLWRLLRRWKQQDAQTRATHILQIPDMGTKEWWRFFRNAGLSHLSFHCLRVTFVTRHCLLGTEERVVMRLVNHGSTLVHRIYQKFQVHDLRGFADILDYGKLKSRPS